MRSQLKQFICINSMASIGLKKCFALIRVHHGQDGRHFNWCIRLRATMPQMDRPTGRQTTHHRVKSTNLERTCLFELRFKILDTIILMKVEVFLVSHCNYEYQLFKRLYFQFIGVYLVQVRLVVGVDYSLFKIQWSYFVMNRLQNCAELCFSVVSCTGQDDLKTVI